MAHPVSGRQDGVLIADPARLKELRRLNNPKDEKIGHFTGRCKHCASDDLWEDPGSYGCNCCGALLSVGNQPLFQIATSTTVLKDGEVVPIFVFLPDD